MPVLAHGDTQAAASHELLADLLVYLMILKRRWRILAVTILVCLTFAILYLAQSTRYYEASSRVLILQQGGRPLNVGSNNPVEMMGGTDDLLATHGMIVSSPVVVGLRDQCLGSGELAHARPRG